MTTALERLAVFDGQADGGSDLPVAELEAVLLAHPDHVEGDCYPLVHRFAPGVYAREITMPGDTIVIGKKHRTRHLNIISQGDVSFWVRGESVQRVQAPYTFISEPGIQKVLYVHRETVWTTIHPTDETDLTVLEAQLIDASRIAAPESPVLPEGTP